MLMRRVIGVNIRNNANHFFQRLPTIYLNDQNAGLVPMFLTNSTKEKCNTKKNVIMKCNRA
jgi:hypothetical protein